MTRKQLLLRHAGTRVDDLPPEIRARVEADPQLRDELAAQARVAGLMSLKAYERPDEAMDGRVRDRVRIRIRNGETAPTVYSFDLLPDWARMVAVVVVMLALSLITHREMLDSSTAPETAGPAVVEVRDFTPRPSMEELRLETVDPFTTYVLNPGGGDTGDYLQTVFNPRLEQEPYLQIPSLQTNRLDGGSTLLPVVAPIGP